MRRTAKPILLLCAACATEAPWPAGPDSLALTCENLIRPVPLGVSVRPGADPSKCLLPADSGAEYALAILDPGAIESSEVGREQALTDYLVDLSAVGATPRQPSGRSGAPAIAPVPLPFADVVAADEAAAALASPADRERPWTLDERFELLDPYQNSDATARVLRIYEGGFVVAWFENGDPARLTTWLPRLDSAFGVADRHAFPLLRSTFVDAPPRTSTGSGQYLILLRDSLPLEYGANYTGVACSRTAGDTAFTWIHLKVDTAYTATGLASLVTHEMTHSYQRMYMHATRGTSARSVTAAALWGSEGGANLLSYETMRRYAGLPLDGNYDWRAPQATAAAGHVARRAQPGGGLFTAGYEDAMGFLRHLVVRLTAAGSPVDGAVRVIARGAAEGWYGYDGITARPGLVRRVRAVLGYRWEPDQALLDWTLSHAADDLTSDPELQDRTSLRVWDIPVGQAGWRASATLSAGAGDSAAVRRRYSSPFFVYLRDAGTGIDFRVTASRLPPEGDALPAPQPTPLPNVHWKLVRIR